MIAFCFVDFRKINLLQKIGVEDEFKISQEYIEEFRVEILLAGIRAQMEGRDMKRLLKNQCG